MKIDKTKLKKNNSEVPGDCGWLIEKLNSCSDEELLPVLQSIESWSYGKCELHHWVNVLDRFDFILETATKREEDKWVLPCDDLPENAHMQELVVWVLYFTTLLVEHSFSRHLYSSVEHLNTLLSSSSMTVVLAVLNLLYMFSKRSNFITRLASAPRQALLSRLIHLAESWGGKENGFGLAQCCQNLPLSSYPTGATTLHFEFYGEQKIVDASASPVAASKYSCSNSATNTIHINNIQSISKSPAEIMEELLEVYKVPVDKQMLLFTHLRLAHSFARYETRLQCVQARLQAISILVYCNSLQDNAYTVLYSGLLDEFVDVLEIKDTNLTEIKAATLRTLTSIIHLERLPNFPKLGTIIDVTGAFSYHGFLPVLVRSCISTLTSSIPVEPNPFPAQLATSLFSFLYHLASFEAGGEALVSCGMMESLLSVVTWVGTEPDHITFVTRAVRVIDLITNLDMNAFQTHGGLNIFIKRLESEVNECRKEQPFVIQLPAPLGTEPTTVTPALTNTTTVTTTTTTTTTTTETSDSEMPGSEGDARDSSLSPMDVTEPANEEVNVGASTSKDTPECNEPKGSQTCLPQRAALLKSMLNFLKKDIQDPGFSESMRHLMESSLPSSLKHIISNAEYYGPSLFLLATDVVTVYVFGEPSLLSSLQDNGLTDVVLHALLVKDVPATREVLASLPNVFSALCLNSRGLAAFVACKPFERLFKVLLSPDYLPAMRRRRSSDPMGDTASNLGNAMDELMRHQPSLKPQAMIAIVKLLEEVCLLGSDAHYVCWKTPPKNETTHLPQSRQTNDNSSDEDEEEEEERETGVISSAPAAEISAEETPPTGDKRAVPLVDYVLNVMKFVDAILSNNSTDDHCKEFVAQKGLVPLLGILGLPNLPIDFHGSLACQAVASVCKSILNLAHESGVLQQGLQCLHERLEALAPLHEPVPHPGGSVLLRELALAPNSSEATTSFPSTPLLHTLGAIHAYIMMLVHVCRTGQMDIRQVSMKQWGTELGLKVLAGLTKLYTSLVWESTVLLALCSDDALPAGCLFAKEDLMKLLPPDLKIEESPRSDVPMEVSDTEGLQLSLEGATSSATPSASTEGSSKSAASHHQVKSIKPLLSAASRLGKSLAELFGLLVKLCVGSPLRQRRGQQVTTPLTPPSPAAVAVASALSNVLHAGLSWLPPPSSPLPKFRLTFLLCSVRFNNPMLFDDKKMPYHLMLQHFVKSQGLKAFFDIFNWAITASEDKKTELAMIETDNKELPDGTGEFLDTWLFLLEKLVNPKTMLDSPHSLPSKVSFCPLKFLIKIHKLAFEAVMKLWNKKPLKNYGVKISESVLVILCSILKGESIIAERLAKEKAGTSTPSSNPNSTSVTPAPTMAGDTVSSNLPVPAVETSVAVILSTVPLAPTPVSSVSRIPTLITGEPSSLATAESSEVQPVLVPYSLDDSPVEATPTPTLPAEAPSEAPTEQEAEASAPPTAEPPVQHPYLQALLDMGFAQDRCLEAITHSHTLEQATEYLLTNPIAAVVEGDMDYSEEDHQWLAAVAMSLRENNQPNAPAKPSFDLPSLTLVENEEPLSKSKLDEFTANVLEGCLEQLDVQPQLVYKVCELLTTCVTRNGEKWRETMLKTLMAQISEQTVELSLIASQGATADTTEYICSSPTALKFGIRLHLVTLLFEEMKSGCAGALKEVNLVESLVDLLCYAQEVMSANPEVLLNLSQAAKDEAKKNSVKDTKLKEKESSTDSPYTPKWLAPAMLLLDLHEKLSVALKRRAEVKKVSNHVWKWFDVSAIKWFSYNQSNNKTIDEAYWAGESLVRIVNGRKKYTIQFHSMLQVNEETGNRRPIMISVSDKMIGELKKKSATTETTEMEGIKEDQQEEPLELTKPKPVTDAEKMECEEPKPAVPLVTEELPQDPVINGFTDAHKERMIRSCVGYMKLGVEPDTLHALMRLCLRITRDWHLACLFASLGGVRTLLNLTQQSAFWGIQNLTALLMRHILEEPNTLRHTMKKVVRYSSGSSTGVGAKELHSLLRLLAPAACRNTEMFTEISKQCLRIDLSMALKRNMMTTSNEDSILMKSIGSKGNPTPSNQNYSQLTSSDNSEPQILINDLLESLATTDEEEPLNPGSCNPSTSLNSSTPTEDRPTGFSNLTSGNRHLQLSRSSSANDMVVQELDEQSPMESDANKVLGAEAIKPATTDDSTSPKKKKSLLSKSTICKLLAEFVRSYAGVAKLITDHQYSPGINDKILEECSALAYLLDQLVCANGEQEIVNHVRVLIAALASCNHAPDAQAALVSEVKGCLSRVMCLPESAEKHSKIQALVGLTGTMMDACPSQLNQPVNSCFKQQQQQLGMNNMIRIMIKKSLVIDLARIPHCLDLSSPNMAATVNAALKPLETVLRIVNLPSFAPVQISKKKNSPPDDQAPPTGTGTTNSETTQAQGEENTEDAENTEHDISAAGETLEPTLEVVPNEDGTLAESDETGLDEILDQLLDDPGRPRSRENRSTPHRDDVTATVTFVLDHDPPMDTDDTLHDSRMVSHSESQFLCENEDGGNDDNDDSSSSEGNDNEDNEDEVEEDDDDDDDDGDDDDDDDDDEEDEEDGSVFDEGYEDLEEAFIRLPGERDNDDILMLPSYQQYIDTIDTIIFGDRLPYSHQSVTHDESVFMASTPNATANTNNAIPNHPLFQNPREAAVPPSTRVPTNRPNRQRGVLRLLGQTHREVLQLTTNLREATQLIITNPDVRPLLPDHDEIMDSSDSGGQYFHCSNRSSSNTTLPTVPNALTRWMEEARVLESDSLHDAVTQIKPQLMAVLEKYRDIEQAERDKKKKELEALKATIESKNADATGDKATSEAEAPVTTSVVSSSASSVVTPSGSVSNSDGLNMMISILEQQFSSPLTPSSPPTGRGTQVAPASSAAGTLMSLVEPHVTAHPEFASSLSADVSANVSAIMTPSTDTSTSVSESSVPVSVAASESSITTTPALQILSTPSSYSEPFMTSSVPAPNFSVEVAATSSSFLPAAAPVNELTSFTSENSFPPAPISITPLFVPPSNTAVTTTSVSSDEAMSISPASFEQMAAAHSAMQLVVPLATEDNEPRTFEEEDSQPQNLVVREERPTGVEDIDNSNAEAVTTPEAPVVEPTSSVSVVRIPLSESSNPSGTTSTTTTSGTIRPIHSDYSAILGDLEIPEGVDPSFLAALPEDMRQEVISEQLRIQRVRERAVEGTQESTNPTIGEVNPEFLAALPPNIQEEVLAQQRIEQQRQQAATANPDDPVSFLQTLPQGLRQSILSDLEDSQFSALPPDVAQEAQSLRRQREDRSRNVHQHMFTGGGSTISHILRSTARLSSRFLHSPSWSSWNVRSSSSNQPQITSSSKVKGQQLLDHEAMTCLLVLLFVDEPKLHTTRLHRVLKSLCHHPPTREWVVKTLLSIIERCSEQGTSTISNKSLGESEMSGLSLDKKGEKKSTEVPMTSTPNNSHNNWKSESSRAMQQPPSWLSMSMDAALGCRASIFQIQRNFSTGKKTPGPSAGTSVHIHPQAAPLVCRHAIDLLISLAKTFPSHFLPTPKEADDKVDTKKSSGAVSKGSKPVTVEPTEFWDLLVKLDSISVSRKGKGLPRTHLNSTGSSDQDSKVTTLETSPLGQLIQQLAHPVVKRSSLLTDRLLRLLALVSLGHPDTADAPAKQEPCSPQSTKALEYLLGLSIEVLTSKSCSEEGLEDATALLLHLSHGPPPARDLVLKLLLQGAATLGQTVTLHIASLLEELKAFNKSHPQSQHEEEAPQQTSDKSKKGLLKDRFTSEQVVIESSSKSKPPCEVQLPSMSALTSKTSSQAFFLRTLKVIIQLRDAIRLAKNRKNKTVKETPTLNNTSNPMEARLETVPPVQPLSIVVTEQQQHSSASQSESNENMSLSSSEEVSAMSTQNMDVSQEEQQDQAPTVTVDPTEPNSEAMEVELQTSENEELKSLSYELGLEELWSTLSQCLIELGETPDTHAVLVLQPAVEAFFLVHASAAVPDKKSKPSTISETREAQLAHLQHEIAPLSPLPASQVDDGSGNVRSERDQGSSESMENDSVKFLKFAETHRCVLNQILRQSTIHLADGPFSVLVDHTRLLDFDIKRKYFRTELERADDGMRREDLAVHVRREHVFEDSFREIHRRSPDEWKNRFYIVFEGEEGQDAGGLLREWYVIISREIFNPMYALFCISPGDRVTYMINPSSHCNSNHLSYFKFVGRVIAKAIYDNKLLECYFTRSFYKHILGKMVRVADMESEDYSFYQGLIYLLEHRVVDLGYELTFSTEVQEFGVTEARDLKPNGRNILVTEESKMEYIRLVCQEKMTGAIKRQLNSFLEGFYDIIPKRLISIFNEQELELLLSGLPTIDIDDLKNNTEYHKYNPNSLQIQWFWRALRSFDQAERAKLVQFVTGTSKVPLQGFAALEGMNGTQKFQIHRDDRSTDRLPSAHTCFNQLDLPVYETYDKLRHYLLKAIQECSEGFGFA